MKNVPKEFRKVWEKNTGINITRLQLSALTAITVLILSVVICFISFYLKIEILNHGLNDHNLTVFASILFYLSLLFSIWFYTRYSTKKQICLFDYECLVFEVEYELHTKVHNSHLSLNYFREFLASKIRKSERIIQKCKKKRIRERISVVKYRLEEYRRLYNLIK